MPNKRVEFRIDDETMKILKKEKRRVKKATLSQTIRFLITEAPKLRMQIDDLTERLKRVEMENQYLRDQLEGKIPNPQKPIIVPHKAYSCSLGVRFSEYDRELFQCRDFKCPLRFQWIRTENCLHPFGANSKPCPYLKSST